MIAHALRGLLREAKSKQLSIVAMSQFMSKHYIVLAVSSIEKI
jgi:hypothetical protein